MYLFIQLLKIVFRYDMYKKSHTLYLYTKKKSASHIGFERDIEIKLRMWERKAAGAATTSRPYLV